MEIQFYMAARSNSTVELDLAATDPFRNETQEDLPKTFQTIFWNKPFKLRDTRKGTIKAGTDF
jgi:hypothetical protein